MAIRENLLNPISAHSNADNEWEEPWDGHTGLEVETFITEKLKKLIKGMSYNGSMLTLVREDGETIETEVTVETPNSYYGIKLYGIDINGTKHLGDGSVLTTQYTASTVVKLGVILFAISQTTTRTTDMVGPFDVKLTYGSKSGIFKINNVPYAKCVIDNNSGSLTGVTDESSIVWIDVTSLFTSSSNGASIQAVVQKDVNVKNTLNLTIVNQKIDLQYNNTVILDGTTAQFAVAGGTAGKYHLEGFNNGEPFITNSGSLAYTGLQSGLNQLVVCAVHDDDATIKSPYISVDLISTLGVTSTVAAINKVSDSIPNNGIATLYELTVFSPEKDSMELTTYLEEIEPSSTGKTRVKYEVISPSAYDKDYKYSTDYKKYIELAGGNANRYLMVNIDGEYYKFYWAETDRNGNTSASSGIYKAMSIEAIDTTLLPYQGIDPTYNFDQSTGSSNNIIVTADYAEAGLPANVNPKLESSDGWYEENGRTLFRITAQKEPLFTQPKDLALGNSFSIELGFKTFNVSDEKLPIMTLGNLQLRPTQFCWNTNNNTLFMARNSQFQSEHETHLLITVEGGHKLTKQSSYYPNYLGDYQAAFDNAVTSLSYNLVRVFVNGVIDREIVLTDEELDTLRKGTLQFNPTASDIDLYMLRVYSNSALPMDAVINNYTSFLRTKEEKLAFQDANDILDPNTGEVSFDKCYGKYNTIVLVTPAGARFPNRAWGEEDGAAKKKYKDFPVTVFINYADPEKNKIYGGKFVDLQYQGQGSSAMRYLIWNTQVSTNKFKDKQVDALGNAVLDEDGKQVELKRPSAFIAYTADNFDEDAQVFKPEASATLSGYYLMPPYDGQKNSDGSKVAKMVGKVNFASSMQAHKPGSVRLFDDAYRAAVGNLQTGGRKACNEEPFLYFYWESDRIPGSKSEKRTAEENKNKDFWKTRSADAIQLVNPIDLLNNPDVHFMGFHTWGSAKCDDATYGYDKKLTPGYVLIEGGENTEPVCNFKIPWMALQRTNGTGSTKTFDSTVPTLTKQESIDQPWANLFIDDESIVETSRGAWDVDYGLEELEDKNVQPDEKGNYPTYFEFSKKAQPALNHFRRFHDFVYSHDYTFRVTTSMQPEDNWATKFKYVLSNPGQFTSKLGKVYNNCRKGDVFRWDAASQDWVPGGLYFNNGVWESFNVYDFIGQSGTTASWDFVRHDMRILFELGIGEFVDTDDVSFHQAFVKFVSGTDNRAKNTYFQILGTIYKKNPDFGKEGHESEAEYIVDDTKDGMKIRFMADDLDTVLLTDNNGLQSKAYNLVEDSYRETPIYSADLPETYATDWGDANNAFFYMYDQAFESDIKNKLNSIINVAFDQDLNVNNDNNYFCKQYFGIQTYFPAVSYNHMSQIYYENAKYVLDAKCIGNSENPLYGNNSIDPIEQAHGSCLAAEREFMSKRLPYLATYAQSTKLGDASFRTAASAGNGEGIRLTIKMEPYQDFYPLLMWEKNTFINMKNSQTDKELHDAYKFATIEKVVKAGKEYELQVAPATTAINQGIYNIGLYKKLDITGLKYPTLSTTMTHTTDLTIDNANLNDEEGNRLSFYGNSYPELQISSFTASLPVIQNLNLRNIQLPDGLDLSKAVKLQNLDLTNSSVKNIIFPESGRLNNLSLPKTITTFEIYNNPNLQSVEFESIENLESVYIQCDKCGAFDVDAFCEQLAGCGNLKSVILRNADLYITEEALLSLCTIAKCQITGTIHVIASVDDTTTLKQISFYTKKQLVNTFGDFTANDSKLRILYSSVNVETSDVIAETEVSLYSNTYPAVKPNAFNVQVMNGNNVAIITPAGGKPMMNITYSMSSTSAASIDQYTGDVTLKAASTSKATVTITVTLESGTKITKTCSVAFQWTAPKIGDFVYSTGEYSSGYTSAKKLVGLVYAVDATTTTSGTAYIIGAEHVSLTNSNNERVEQEYYLGYAKDGNASAASAELKDMGVLTNVLNSLSISNYDVVRGTTVPTNIDNYSNISSTNYPDYAPSAFSGKADTAAYVNHVNSLLATLYTSNSTLRSRGNIQQEMLEVDGNSQTVYNIASLAKLNALAKDLQSVYQLGMSSPTSEMASALLFPYFYSMYLYEPDTQGADLNSQFTKGNWYAPSVYELARVYYYRGYSAGLGFVDQDDVRKEINANTKSNPNNVKEIAIFSNALKLMGNAFPTCWKVMAGTSPNSNANNITTSQDASNGTNYGYLSYYQYSGSAYIYYSAWRAYGITSNATGAYLLKRNTKHKGIPFTEFKYSKE